MKNLILYIHFNPQIHFGIGYKNCPFSSYQAITEGNKNIINIEETIDLFENIKNLKTLHEQQNFTLEEKFRLE